MLKTHVLLSLRWALRDRLLHAVLGAAFFLLLLIPAFSLFSMRQVQELAITLCLSLQALVLLVLVLVLGGFSLWREVDRRYTASVLTLPVSRGQFVVGRFVGIALFLAGTVLLLSVVSATVILFAGSFYPSALPPQWSVIALAAAGLFGKFLLLAAVAVLFSSLSTSFFLPFFGTLAVYFGGNASQQVYDYVTNPLTEGIATSAQVAVRVVYCLLPNLSALDFKVQAIYGLPIDPAQVGWAVVYLLSYLSICLWLAVYVFTRRQFP